MGRSKHSGPDSMDTNVPGENSRNSKGKLSEQSKERRKKRKYQERGAEEVVEEMKKNNGRYTGTKL